MSFRVPVCILKSIIASRSMESYFPPTVFSAGNLISVTLELLASAQCLWNRHMWASQRKKLSSVSRS